MKKNSPNKQNPYRDLFNVMDNVQDINEAGEKMTDVLKTIPYDQRGKFYNEFKAKHPKAGKYFDIEYKDMPTATEGSSGHSFRLLPIDQTVPKAKKVPVTPTGKVRVVGKPNAIQRLVSPAKKTVRAPKLTEGVDYTDLLNFFSNTADPISALANSNQQDGMKSTGGAAISGAATGAKIGSKLGPWGALGGAVIGGGASLLMANKHNKEVEEQNAQILNKEQAALNMRNVKPTTNTQATMYEDGTPAAAITEPVEVEKDELVMRKNALGKYSVVADFKHGETHDKGGEDFVIQEGDVVFPGKKRKKIMDLLKTNNHAGIESERLKLPKDIPVDSELVDGVNREVKLRPHRGTTPLWLKDDIIEDATLDYDPIMRDYPERPAPPKPLTPKAASTANIPIKNSPKLVMPETDEGAGKESNDIDLSGANDALRYAPAAANMIRGLSRPEKVKRRFFTPETQRYKDMSDPMRAEVAVQAAIDAENASRFSGGSGQVARAGKSLSGSQRLRRLQEINAGETGRATQIEAQNVATRNQAKAANIDLAGRYDDMDAQNRAAIDSYFDQGVHDLSRISGQMSRDRAAERNQQLMLDLMETGNFVYDKKGNKIKLKNNSNE